MMGVAGARTRTRIESEDRGAYTFRKARWLAGQEIRRSWLSYPVTALATLVVGLFVAAAVDGVLVFEGGVGPGYEDRFQAFFADYFFLNFGALLAVNWMSREYFRVFSEDAFTDRLVFLRSLPVSAAVLVVGRLVSMGLSLLLNALAFFVPVYLISNLNGLGWNFLWFAAAWLGYSLFGAGLALLTELTIHGKTYVWLSLAGPVLLIFAVILLEWTVDLRIVARIAGLAEAYGPLPALVSLLVGATALIILTRATIRRVARRDLSA